MFLFFILLSRIHGTVLFLWYLSERSIYYLIFLLERCIPVSCFASFHQIRVRIGDVTVATDGYLVAVSICMRMRTRVDKKKTETKECFFKSLPGTRWWGFYQIPTVRYGILWEKKFNHWLGLTFPFLRF
jgi:hypothetical protein